MRHKTQKRGKYKKTTVLLPYDLWQELRIESIKRGIPIGIAYSSKVERTQRAKAKDPSYGSGQAWSFEAIGVGNIAPIHLGKNPSFSCQDVMGA